MDQKGVLELSNKLIDEVEKIIIGKRDQLEKIVMSIFSSGHILLDDLPGSGKTTLVKTLSLALGCGFKRVQFTTDLLPSDILGMNIFNQKTGEFQFVEGPIHTHILLADEINRAIPRTQSALLEAMEEGQITVDGVTYPLPSPFLVMATQNPVESESTFHLPAAQMDRFFIRLSLGYPTVEEEIQMLERLGDFTPFETITSVTDPKEILDAQKFIETIHVSNDIKEYIVGLVHQTRESAFLKCGASPRASRSLYKAGKAFAAMHGRDYVSPEDIKAAAVPVMAHRLMLSNEARFQGKTAESLVEEFLSQTPVPPAKEALFDA